MTNWEVIQRNVLPRLEGLPDIDWDGEAKFFDLAAPEKLFCFEDFLEILSHHKVQPGDIAVTGHGKPEVLYQHLVRPDGFIDIDTAIGLFKAGYTFVVNRVQLFSPTLQELTLRLFDARYENASINAYVSPPNSQGFPRHYDPHAVIAIQTQGRKRWDLFEKTGLKATLDTIKADLTQSPPAQTQELREGDVLFIPRGIPHACQATTEVSIHLSVHFAEFVWADLLREAADILAREQPTSREYLPADPANSKTSTALQSMMFSADLLAKARESLTRKSRRAMVLESERRKQLFQGLSGYCSDVQVET